MIRRSPCPIVCVTPEDNPDSLGEWHYFFGYYDKCPWNARGTHMLAHRAGFVDHFPTPTDVCEIGVLDPAERSFTPLASTGAWNWQQGAQLQWINWLGDTRDERILFNSRRDDDHLETTIIRPNGGGRITLEHPTYTVAPDGKTALTLAFERLSHCRPEYGYAGLVDPHQTNPAPKHSGIWRVDLATDRCEQLVSIGELASHKSNAMGDGRVHHVNHLMFNPSGTRFCFMHRFERADGITHSRLFTLGTDGSGLRLLFEGLVSHYDWIDDGTILAWAGRRKILGGGGSTGAGGSGGGAGAKRAVMTMARRTLKPVYYAMGKPRWMMSRIVGDSYMLIPDAEEGEAAVFARGDLSTDGHCTMARSGPGAGRFVLTDGYPDMGSRQPLFLYDTRDGVAHEIGRYPTPRALDGPTRVDLHPRFDRTGTRVCIDSAMDGRRRMYVVDVSAIVGVPARERTSA